MCSAIDLQEHVAPCVAAKSHKVLHADCTFADRLGMLDFIRLTTHLTQSLVGPKQL